MEKEKTEDQINSSTEPLAEKNEKTETDAPSDENNLEEKTPEDKITVLEEKIVRQYAEMENQREKVRKRKR